MPFMPEMVAGNWKNADAYEFELSFRLAEDGTKKVEYAESFGGFNGSDGRDYIGTWDIDGVTGVLTLEFEHNKPPTSTLKLVALVSKEEGAPQVATELEGELQNGKGKWIRY